MADGDVDLLITDGIVATMDDQRRVFDPGYVAVSGDRIVAAGPAADAASYTARETRSAQGMVVLPGLINLHAHLANSLQRGLYDELPLTEWYSGAMWKGVRASTRQTSYEGARISIAENLLAGTTTVVAGEFGVLDRTSIDGGLQAVTESGIRAVVARVCVDEGVSEDPSQASPEDVCESVDGVISELDRLRRTFNTELIEVVPEPLGVLRCTPDLVRALSEYARSEGTRMTMHLASSQNEVDECARLYGVGPVQRVAQLGALGPNLLIAHGVYVSDEEIVLLADSRTGVGHCPVSNMMYATGTARLAELLDGGVRVGLGTDGQSSNNGQSLWDTMKYAVFVQKSRFDARWGSAELALELATIRGARAIGMEESIGSLEVGKKADLILVDLSGPQFQPTVTWPSNIVYANLPSAVRTVVVDGSILVDDGQLCRWDASQLAAGANRAAAEMEAQTGLAVKYRARSRWSWVES